MNPVRYVKSYGIKHTLKVIYQYKIDDWMRKMIKVFTGTKLISNSIVIESHNDFDSTGGAFYDYLIQNGYNKKYKKICQIM